MLSGITYTGVGATLRRMDVYTACAERHKPSDPQLLRNAILDLRRLGLRPRDIADCTRTPLDLVLSLLFEEETSPCK